MFDCSTTLLLADGDIPSAVIWLVLIVGITLVQKAVEYMKKKNEREDSSENEIPPWKPLPRRIDDIIKSLEKKPEQQQHPVKPVRPQEKTTMEKAAESMSRVVSPSAEAQYSLNGLSEAELAALERLKKGAMPSAPTMNVARPASVSRQAVPANSLRAGLATRNALQTAILYQEILGKPIALRD